MTVTRTPDLDPVDDAEFEVPIPITKSWVDTKTGRRYLTGVATGVAEDRDGERCSVNCVKSMGEQIQRGGVKVTAAHQQDWMTEIGDVHKASYDPETDELAIEAVLPPEGVDPIADKAWRTANTEKVGWSIGGKLLKHFYERNEIGKKRKVLDAILLKHVALTKNPAYAGSFATAVAKTYDGPEPDDSEFQLVDADAEVAKSLTTGSWVNGSSEFGGGNVGRDSLGSGPRNNGSSKAGAKMRTDAEDPPKRDTSEDDSDEGPDDGKDLPQGKDQQRHLSCPNCGHEFAAYLPVGGEEQQLNDTPGDRENDDADKPNTGKSRTERPMPSLLSETLDVLKAQADEAVAKTVAEPDPEPARDLTDVEKALATSHRLHEDRLDRIEAATGEGFELIAKSLKRLEDSLAELPVGRKSVARVLPSTVGHDEEVGKTVQQAIEEAPDALSALKVLNRAAGWTRD